MAGGAQAAENPKFSLKSCSGCATGPVQTPASVLNLCVRKAVLIYVGLGSFELSLCATVALISVCGGEKSGRSDFINLLFFSWRPAPCVCELGATLQAVQRHLRKELSTKSWR